MSGQFDQTLFLSVGEAAQRLGTSRMRVREAIATGLLPAQKDNGGNWRVRLDPALRRLDQTGREHLSADVMIELLFDEVQELQLELAHKERLTSQLSNLLDGRADERDHPLGQPERRQPDENQIEALNKVAADALDALDQTVQKLAARTGQIEHMGGLLDRSFGASERLERQVAERDAVIEKQMAVIERLFALAEGGLDLSGRMKPRNTNAFDRLLGRTRWRE